MRRIEVTPRPEAEAEDILHRSLIEFGDAAAERYGRLIFTAYRDLADDPDRPRRRRIRVSQFVGPGR